MGDEWQSPPPTKMEKNKIYNIDCLEGIKQIEDNSIDLVVMSPPYKRIDLFSYNLIEKLIKELWRVLKKDKLIFINFGYFKDDILRPLKVLKLFQTKFNLIDIILWEKTNPQPVNSTKWLTPAYEYIFCVSKGKDYEFNKKPKEYIKNIIKFPIPNTPYENTFPKKLPKFCIELASKENDLVMDCFIGSGTTAVVCKQLNRNFIGFEINKEYCDIANKRLSQKTVGDFEKPI